MTTIFLLIAFIVIAYVLYATHSHPEGLYLLPTDDRKWKRVIELYYTHNILTVITFDGNHKDFYHGINDPSVGYGEHGTAWRRWPSKTIIKDKELNRSLDKCYKLVLKGQYKKGEGWRKVFAQSTETAVSKKKGR